MQHRGLPAGNLFSHTEPDHPWVLFEWLGQVIFHGAHALGGVRGLYGLQLLLAGAIWGGWWVLGWRVSRSPVLATLGLLLVLPFLQVRFVLRPELFSHLFAAVLFGWLVTWRPSRWKAFVPLWVAQVLWANLHGYFFMGPVIVGWWVIRQWVGGGVDRGRVVAGVIGLVGMVLACGINPYGFRLFSFLLEHQHSVMLAYVPEFELAGAGNVPVAVVGLAAWVAVVFAVGLRVAPRTFLLDLLLLGTLCLQGLLHVRFLWLLGTVAVGVGWEVFASQSSWKGKASPLAKPLTFAALAAVLVAGWWAWPRQWHPRWVHNEPLDQALAFVEQHRLHGTLYNEKNDGSWIIFHHYPQLRTFVDGRFAFSEAFFREVLGENVLNTRDFLGKYEVELVVRFAFIDDRTAHYTRFPAGGPWQPVFFSGVYQVSVTDGLRGNLPAYRTLCPCRGREYLERLAAGDRWEQVDLEMIRYLEQGDPAAPLMAARWYRLSHRTGKALRLLEAMDGSQRWVALETALSLGEEGEYEAAMTWLEKATPLTPQRFQAPVEVLAVMVSAGQEREAVAIAEHRARASEDELVFAAWLAEHHPHRVQRRWWRDRVQARKAVVRQAMEHELQIARAAGNWFSALRVVEALLAMDGGQPQWVRQWQEVKRKTGTVYPEDLDPSLAAWPQKALHRY